MIAAHSVTSDQIPSAVSLHRAERRASRSSIRLAALRVPLVAKLVGANLFVVAVLIGAHLWMHRVLGSAGIALIVGLIVAHLVLVIVALRPIRDLEDVAGRVWQGDFGARVERSLVADQDVLRIGSMFNILLDGLATDRARMRTLATEVIAAGDRERAALARELHDSTAQRMAALLLELGVAARDTSDPALARRLYRARETAASILEEVRLMAHTVHPAVLDDLGLVAALQKLARDSSNGNGIDFDVDADKLNARLPRNVEAVLYRVAQEAVRNATRHASPARVRLTLDSDQSTAVLRIHDDGTGFELAEAERRRPGMGLLSMRERLALIDGSLDIKTAKGSGTTVTAHVPLQSAAEALH